MTTYRVRFADDPLEEAVEVEALSRARAAIRFAKAREDLEEETFELVVADADGAQHYTIDVERVLTYYAHSGEPVTE